MQLRGWVQGANAQALRAFAKESELAMLAETGGDFAKRMLKGHETRAKWLSERLRFKSPPLHNEHCSQKLCAYFETLISLSTGLMVYYQCYVKQPALYCLVLRQAGCRSFDSQGRDFYVRGSSELLFLMLLKTPNPKP